ncbi:MAG: DUF2520 domain-containing protein [Paludibacter sp.]|nr:DUF2520 domain-containing protein [Paludibacter sp.]
MASAVILGAGNVATHLAPALLKAGIDILQIYSRTETSASVLAAKVNAVFCTDPDKINDSAHYYFYALKDSAIAEVLNYTGKFKGIHVHTAGSVGLEVFEGKAEQYGILYPLQTFSKEKETDFSQVPLFIEGKNEDTSTLLKTIADKLSTKTYFANSEQRARLHLAAVFACNFSNLLYDIASEIVNEEQGGFEVLKPLISETAEKVQNLSPRKAQTGPATRYDTEIIDKHIAMLSQQPELADLYEKLSKMIYQRRIR